MEPLSGHLSSVCRIFSPVLEIDDFYVFIDVIHSPSTGPSPRCLSAQGKYFLSFKLYADRFQNRLLTGVLRLKERIILIKYSLRQPYKSLKIEFQNSFEPVKQQTLQTLNPFQQSFCNCEM